MTVTTRLVDKLSHDFNSVSASGGTATFDIDLSTYTLGKFSVFELRANVEGISYNSSAFDGFKARTTCVISWNSSGNTRLATASSGSSNPITSDFTNDCADTNFSTSTAVWSAVSSSSKARLTITNNGSVENDFTVYVEVIQSTNAITAPTQLSGLKLWLRGDLGVTQSGGTVSSWADQSGNSNNATQGTTANQPTFVSSGLNSLPTLRFDGVNDSLTFASAFQTQIHIFLVFKQVTIQQQPIMSIGSATNGFTLAVISGNQFWLNQYVSSNNSNQGQAGTAGSAPSGFQVYSANGFAAVASTNVLYEDGTNKDTGSSGNGSFSPTGNAIGSNGGSTFGNLEFAEIIIYNRALTTTERKSVQNYLGNRYAVTIS